MVTLQPHTGLPRRAVGEGKPLRSRVKVVLAVVLFFFFFFFGNYVDKRYGLYGFVDRQWLTVCLEGQGLQMNKTSR